MPFESGGLADKLGNRYEGRWVVLQLLSLLDEKIQSVTIEAIGDDERGVDLWVLQNNGIRQAQQCKARNSSKEYWSISDLIARGVLSQLQFQLDRDLNCEFAFVSSLGSEVFQDICEYSRRANNNATSFYQEKILRSGQEVQKCFRLFCKALALDPEKDDDRNRAFDYLRRSYINVYHDDQLTWQNLLDKASYLLIGDAETVIATLVTYAENNNRFGSPIYADELRKYLSVHGIQPKRLEHDARITPAIEELQNQFADSIRPLFIDNKPLQRNETLRLIEAVEEGKNIILSGPAGYGKSGVLFELSLYLQKGNIPYLPIRLDRRTPEDSAKQFGQKIGLPDCPAFSLSALAGERKSILILDQLDAIRWTSAHSNNALDVCKELVHHVRSLRMEGKKIAIVLSSRTFDLEHDPAIKNWLAGKTDDDFIRIDVKELSNDVLQQIIGAPFSGMTEKEKTLLACPQNLSIWMELKRTGTVTSFRTPTDLIRAFWENRRLILDNQAGITPDQVNQVLTPLIAYMEQYAKISAPERIVSLWPKITESLFSYGVLQKSASEITFCHQRYLDYLIAERLLHQIDAGAGSILDWLGGKEKQSLFKREQLRQSLVMLTEESPQRFLQSARQILDAEEVRFHIKHLVLEIIGSEEQITEELGEYCLTLYNNPFWQEHILETVFLGHPPYVIFLHEKGIITQWLTSEDKDKINRALWLLRTVTERIPDLVSEILDPYVEKGTEWFEHILNTLPWRITDDSERMFQLRLKLARYGVFATFVEWKTFSDSYPLRAIQLIEAVLSNWTIDDTSRTSRNSRFESWYDEDWKALQNVAKNYPADTWDHLIPHIERLTCFDAEHYDPRLERWTNKDFLNHQHEDIARGVVNLVMIAGESLASSDADAVLARTHAFENSSSRIVQEILNEVYCNLPSVYADVGINWLLTDVSRFRLGSGYDEPEWLPAVMLIKSQSPNCSESLFHQLEETIIHYHSPDEKQLAGHYLRSWRDGYYGHYWGEAQYFLLPALAIDRICNETAALIKVLQRKFGQDYFRRGSHLSGGLIGSKLDPSLERISDRAWLDIISSKKVTKDGNHKWIQVDVDHALDASIRQFSHSLEIMSKRFPERFGRLASRFPDHIDSSYVSAILDGCGEKAPDSQIPDVEKRSWAPASVQTVEAVLEKFNSLDDRKIAMSFCRFVWHRAKENWSDVTLSRLIYYAKNHPDPEPEKLNICCNQTADEASIETLFQNTINCVRGTAAQAIAQLLWKYPGCFERLRPGIESLVQDQHPAVRVAAIEILLPVINLDKDQAVEWFVTACNDDLRVAASPRAQHFFNHTVQSHFENIAPIIEKMLSSPLDDVVKEGARQVTARWLFYGFFEKELLACQSGTIPKRQGIAEIASRFLSDEKHSENCKKLLRPLLNDLDKEVRKELHGLFRNPNLFNNPALQEFILECIASQTFADSPRGIVYSLKNMQGSILYLSEAIFAICDAYSTTLKEKSRDVGSTVPHTISETLSILLRLYEQAQSTEKTDIASRCLDIWDTLFQNRVGIVRSLSNAIEQ
ncbi:MAG: hypothetical protein C4550_07080 [Nitrospiraceae bacterium]|nr:MAG: hypothetical protein C4550_07080 [Nitrospiraceae bacterium]